MAGMARAVACLVLVVAVASCATDVPASTAAVSVGGTWRAVDVVGHKPDALVAPRIQFVAPGRIQGATGCTDFSARVRIEGDRVSVRALEREAVPCERELRQVDLAFLAALGAAERIAGGRDDGRLVLSGSAGEIVFVQPAPGPS
jgi:heat shock protein HslJ